LFIFIDQIIYAIRPETFENSQKLIEKIAVLILENAKQCDYTKDLKEDDKKWVTDA
jgi:hypothetical protein